jgi:hypothetical protein
VVFLPKLFKEYEIDGNTTLLDDKQTITIVFNHDQTKEIEIEAPASHQDVLLEARLTGKDPAKLRLLRGNAGWLAHIITEDELIRAGDTVLVIETDYAEGDFRYILVHVYAQKDLGKNAIRRRPRVFKVSIEESLADIISLAGLWHLMYLQGATIYLLNQDFSKLEQVDQSNWNTGFEKFNCPTAEETQLQLPIGHVFLITSTSGHGPWVPQTPVSKTYSHQRQVEDDHKAHFTNTGEDHRVFKGITMGELQLQTMTVMTTATGAIENSTIDMKGAKTTSYELEDRSEFIRMIIHTEPEESPPTSWTERPE